MLRASFLLFSSASLANNGQMSEHIYKKIELVGSSPNGFEEAVKNALVRGGGDPRIHRERQSRSLAGDAEDRFYPRRRVRSVRRIKSLKRRTDLAILRFFFLHRLIELGGAVN